MPAISIRAAARHLGISKSRASRLVIRHKIRFRVSPLCPSAKLLDKAGVAELAKVAEVVRLA